MSRDPKAEVEISAHSRGLTARLREARAKFGAFGAQIKAGVKDMLPKKGLFGEKGMGFAPGSMLGNLGGSAIGAVGGMLVSTAGDVREFESELNRLGISAKRTPEELVALRDSFRKTSRETGISSAEIVKASRAYFDLTSDADGLATSMRSFARIAQASGSSMEDINKAAAALRDNLDIKPEQFESVFSGFIEQGNAGKIGLRDMGAELVNLAPKFAKFKASMGREGAMQLGAAFQVVAKGFGSASEASTGLERMMAMLQARQKQLRHAGVNVFEVGKDGVARMRNLDQIIGDIRKKIVDPRKFGAIFGDNAEGRAALDELLRRKELYDQVLEAGQNTTAVERDFAARTKSDAGKIDLAFNKMRETLAAAFTPERIAMFASALEKVLGAAVSVVDVLSKLPDAIDVEGTVGRLASEDYTKKAAGLSSQQKYDRAQALLREANDLEAHADDFGRSGMVDRGRARGARDAAAKLAAAARSDTWFMPDRGPQNPFIPQKPVDAGELARAFAKELGPMLRGFLPEPTVKIDGEKVTRAVKSSRDHARR